MTNTPTTDEQLPELPDWMDHYVIPWDSQDGNLGFNAVTDQYLRDRMRAYAREAIAAVAAERNEYVKAAQMLAIDRAEFRVRAEKAEAERDALLADALRWRHIRDECAYSYGDGHTEPVEHGIHLDWMQGAWIRDESNGGIGRPDTFPGWNSLVDNLISNLATELTEDDAIDAAMKGVGG